MSILPDEYSNGRCYGNRCIHYRYVADGKPPFAACDVLCDASEVRTVDHLIDNSTLYPCDKFDDCYTE